MKRIATAFCAVMLMLLGLQTAKAEFTFTDTEFQGQFTTECMDAIIEKYELYDGWYWTTQAGVIQNFHGAEGKPGWTDTAVNVKQKRDYVRGWYGYRWRKDEINKECPNDFGDGECFGFAQFIGYLLTGDLSPHAQWMTYGSIRQAGGLLVGDIVRGEYVVDGKKYMHSAVVYSVNGDEVLFLQTSGNLFNLMSNRQGYYDGYVCHETSMTALANNKNLKVIRSPQNKK